MSDLPGLMRDKWERAMLQGALPRVILMRSEDLLALDGLEADPTGEQGWYRLTPIVGLAAGDLYAYGPYGIGRAEEVELLCRQMFDRGVVLQPVPLEEGRCWVPAVPRWGGLGGD
jgi:hypothetical protein